jgi:hypothetical protein
MSKMVQTLCILKKKRESRRVGTSRSPNTLDPGEKTWDIVKRVSQTKAFGNFLTDDDMKKLESRSAKSSVDGLVEKRDIGGGDSVVKIRLTGKSNLFFFDNSPPPFCFSGCGFIYSRTTDANTEYIYIYQCTTCVTKYRCYRRSRHSAPPISVGTNHTGLLDIPPNIPLYRKRGHP